MKGQPALERFYEKTKRDPETGCLVWGGATFGTGYGKFYFEGKQVTAHRWIFIELHGYAPPVVRHDCDNPPCVEERHLLPGSQGDNIRDAVERKRYRRQGDECKRGHSRWGVNQTSGARKCLDCRADWNRRNRGKSR